MQKAMKANYKQKKEEKENPYSRFEKINGKHPLREVSEDCFVDYQVRTRHGGKVSAFNFALAKEMGLIPKSHPEVLSKKLEKTILETFSIIIINEYDIENDIKFPKKDIRKHPRMATRYLQLQHPNKNGTTSGDGRSVWNGSFKNKGVTWDVQSCGTGATKLSPATQIYGKHFQSGDPSISYGCGYGELDEGLQTLFFSEILNQNGFATERVLAVIEFANNISITVRANKNLLRPSHMFNHLKQGNLEVLKGLVDYYIDRQVANGEWENFPASGARRYDKFLKKQTESFAKMAAKFDDDYIFCWMDWDGDNILMDGGIIDYGSVRQFGLYHDEYRYDDVERYSTSLAEQKEKAKYTVQTFAQIVEYIKSGKRESIKSFKKHNACNQFDKDFEYFKDRTILEKIGFGKNQTDYLLKKQRPLVQDFRKVFRYFESAKSIEGVHEVADGINWNAIFCMRDILRELPQLILVRGEEILEDEFVEIMSSTYATKKDLALNQNRKSKIKLFQTLYLNLVDTSSKGSKCDAAQTLLELTMRSSVINKFDRVTGDSITTVVTKVMNKRPKVSPDEMFQILQDFTFYQNLNPDNILSKPKGEKGKEHKIVKGMLKIVRDYREGI